jgi:hypothetical protein
MVENINVPTDALFADGHFLVPGPSPEDRGEFSPLARLQLLGRAAGAVIALPVANTYEPKQPKIPLPPLPTIKNFRLKAGANKHLEEVRVGSTELLAATPTTIQAFSDSTGHFKDRPTHFARILDALVEANPDRRLNHWSVFGEDYVIDGVAYGNGNFYQNEGKYRFRVVAVEPKRFIELLDELQTSLEGRLDPAYTGDGLSYGHTAKLVLWNYARALARLR